MQTMNINSVNMRSQRDAGWVGVRGKREFKIERERGGGVEGAGREQEGEDE